MRALGASRTSLVPGGVLAGPWVRDDLWRRARAVPSLDLRFADNKSLVDAVTGASLVTFIRASSGTYIDSAGVLQTAATDVPRFNHNPTTGESLGLLVEEQRTNGITNNTMVGAVAGTPGTNPTGWLYATAQGNGLTLSIVGTGVENGINYIDYRFNGTTVASPDTCLIGIYSASAATAQTWTASTYWKLAAGSTTGTTNWQLGVIEATAGGGFVTGALYSQTAPTSAALNTQRPAATRTLSGGATVGLVTFPINVAVTGSTAIDFTLRLGLPQLEQGAFATSPILTSGAAATRNADVASITGSAFSGWYRQDEGTMFVEAQLARQNATAGAAMFGIETNASNAEAIYMHYRGSGATAATVFAGSAGQADFFPYSSAVPANTVIRQAIGVRANDMNAAGGGAIGATDTSCTMPTPDRMLIGFSTTGTKYLSGTIRRLVYWGQRLPNNVLQAITQ
jgi:hypothetical protein